MSSSLWCDPLFDNCAAAGPGNAHGVGSWATTEKHHATGNEVAKEAAADLFGALLRDDLDKIGVNLNKLARAIRVPMNRISPIVNGKRAITFDMALRLARYFGTSAQHWLNLHIADELEVAGERIQARIEREVLPRTAA